MPGIFKHTPGQPCCDEGCSQCNRSLVLPVSQLTFESLSGLHPISFSADIQSAKPTNNTSLVYSPAIPTSANSVSCRWPPSGQSWIHDAGSSNKIVDAFDSDCCWAGLAVADSMAVSPGQQFHKREANELHVVTQRVAEYNGICATGSYDKGTFTIDEYRELQQSGFAKRFVFGVALKACWQLGPGDVPQIRLYAKVFYKDWATIVESGRYAKRERYTGKASQAHATFPPPGAPVCGTLPGEAAYDIWRCGGPDFSFLPDAIEPNPSECFSCAPTSPTQIGLVPLNCTVETIERSILLNTDSACSILGKHVFESGLTPTNKYGFSTGCQGTSIIACRWKWPTHDCPIGSGATIPVAFDVVNTLPSDPDFTTEHVTQTVAASTPVYSSSGSPLLMRWWTEPWTILIS